MSSNEPLTLASFERQYNRYQRKYGESPHVLEVSPELEMVALTLQRHLAQPHDERNPYKEPIEVRVKLIGDCENLWRLLDS